MAGEARDLQREPYTEEERAAIWVDEDPPTLIEPIAVVDYDDEWPLLFQREAARVAGLLGDRALRMSDQATGSRCRRRRGTSRPQPG
jgi:hypothetical protein